MIFQGHVRSVAELHLRLVLSKVPSAVTALLDKSIFDRWVELATARCNELDMLGFIPSRWALDRFIEDAVIAYARVQLEKIGQHSELMRLAKQEADAPKILQ